jgi:hypothetical protein
VHVGRRLALSVAFVGGSACSLLLDFDLQVECWCGERWTVQTAGASTYTLDGKVQPIAASDTTYESCVTQLEHLALDTANPQDPLYLAIRESLQNGAIAQCEAVGLVEGGPQFSHTDCATVGIEPVSANFVHFGPCWDVQSYASDSDPDDWCALDPDSVCVGYYDCSSQPVWNDAIGDDEAGDDSVPWECDEPPAFSADAVRR